MFSASICNHQMDTEFGFYLTNYEDISPQAQLNFREIIGRDGDVNLTKQDGVVRYFSVDRDLRFEKVTSTTNPTDVNVIASALRNAILGEEGKLVFDSDPDYYLSVMVKTIDVSCKDEGRIVAMIGVHADPYKYKNNVTTVTATIDASGSVTLANAKKSVSPTVTVSAEMTLQYTINGTSYTVTLGVGTHIVDTLVLLAGNTVVNVTGSGTIQFQYQEAKF